MRWQARWMARNRDHRSRPSTTEDTEVHRKRLLFMIGSESPDDAGGGAIVVLGGAQIMGMHVIALKAPGEILEEEFVVDAAADINFQRIVNKASGIQVAHARHGVDEGTPLSKIGGDAGTAQEVVLNKSAAAVKAADIGDESDAGKAAEG